MERLQTLGSTFPPLTVNFDFELVAINGFKHVFPSVTVHTYRFHYGQAPCGDIEKLGLIDDFKSKTGVGKLLSRFYGLPFLPPDEVSNVFSYEIMSNSPNTDLTNKFADNFCETYTDTSNFPGHRFYLTVTELQNVLQTFLCTVQFTTPIVLYILGYTDKTAVSHRCNCKLNGNVGTGKRNKRLFTINLQHHECSTRSQ